MTPLAVDILTPGVSIDPRFLMPLDEALDLARENGLTSIEPAGGGHVPTGHLDPHHLSTSETARDEFAEKFAVRGLTIAALGNYGNPLDPNREVAEAFDRDFEANCLLAQQLGVTRLTVVSGAPGGSPTSTVPQWAPRGLFAGSDLIADWQWNERAIPYWRKAAKRAAHHGVTICMEPLPTHIVYSPRTWMRLAEAVDDEIMISLDPSHLWYQGIDPLVAVEMVAGRIGFVQWKDVYFDPRRVAAEGQFPDCSYDDWENRSSRYVALGKGHGPTFWAQFAMALARAKYTGTIAYEFEDAELSPADAIRISATLMHGVLPKQAAPGRNWFEGYAIPPSKPV